MTDKLPAYVLDPVLRCFDSLLATHELLHISMRGINAVSNYPKMDQRIMDLTLQAGREITDEMKAKLQESKRLATFADGELKNGFPFLHAFATVGAWGTLEVTVEDVLLGILLNESQIFGKDELIRIRIPLAKYEQLDKEERMRFILQELARGQMPGAGQGVGSFESLLRTFDLSGEVDEGVRKPLWEMNHVRNIIVHRDSYADLRFVQACPWMDVKTGGRVSIDHEKFGTYTEAICRYVDTILLRLRKRYDASGPGLAAKPLT